LATPDLLNPWQILTLFAFLLGLGLLWYYVQRNKSGLARRMGQHRRIKVTEVAALSPTDRAMILTVDSREFLVLRAKGSAPVVTELTQGAA
jgi:flagellar protein FliO/FliZ